MQGVYTVMSSYDRMSFFRQIFNLSERKGHFLILSTLHHRSLILKEKESRQKTSHLEATCQCCLLMKPIREENTYAGAAPVGWPRGPLTPCWVDLPPSRQNFYYHREKFASVGIFYTNFNFRGNIFVINFELSAKEGKLS